MSRSQENSALLSTKAHSIDAKTGSTRQQFAHEVSTTNAIFRPSQVFPSLSTQENSSKAASYSSVEAGLGRNPEQFIPPLQAHYYPPTVPTAALSMALPYGMIAPPGMDPRSLNFYPYGSPVMSFQNYAASYGQGPRVKNSEEATASDKTSTASTHVRPTESTSRSSKEPMRTESVIKTVTDKQDPVRKPSDPDKRNVTDSQGSNMHIKYPDNDTGSELGSSVDGKKVLPPRDSSLRDVQLREHSLRDAQHDKQPKVNDFDWTREKSSKSKTIEHLGAESSGIKRPTNGLSSWTTENGSFSSHDKSIISSEARSSPYPANEPPTLVPYHSSLPPRSSSSSTYSNVPSTMPKLTPIAPRISNASHLTSSYSADVEHRHSPSFAAKRQNYVYSTNPISSTPSVMGHSGVLPWTANGPGKPPQGDKTEDNWRTKQYPREDRDLNRTGGYESASKVHVARNFNPQPWEQFAHYGPLASHLRAVGADKGFGKKDTEDADFRDLPRDTSREGINSSEQSQVKTVAANKFGTVPVNLRKESDLAGTKITPSVKQEDYQRNQPLVGRNEKSVVGEYVSYNSKTEDAKGNLGNVIVQWKDGPFRVSVERREGGQKYPKPEMSKPSKTEHNRAFSNGYSNYDGRGQGLPHSELKSARNDKGKEDRARIVEPLRSREQALYQENSERKSDSRELSSVSDGRKNNDRNNNSTPLGAFPFYKHVPSGFPLGGSVEQKRFVDRAVVNDSEVSIPPNVTLDKYERREQEMEKNGLKRTEVNSFPRSVEGSHSFITKEDDSKRNEERRSLPRRDEAKPKALTGKFENGKRSVDAEEISSDENDDGHRRVTRETVSPDKRAQLRVAQSSDRRTASPAAGAVRQRRLSSPLSEQRSGTADKRHMTASNNVGMPFGASLQSRRIPSDGSEGRSRDSSTESRMEELGNSGPAQFLRMDGGAFPSPYFGQLLPTPQGLSEAPLLLLDPASFYGAMYRPHMMETPSQGIFPPGGFATDPMTGQIMMLPQLQPEAYIQMVAAENAFMNPMMDPRVAAMWGMPGALDDPQWQQFYQRMQQEQHKQLLEQSKQEFLMGKQGAPFPLASHPFFFGDKRLEQKRKEEMQDVTSTEQQPKSREIQQESSGSQPKETGTRPKVEPLAPQERTQHVTTSPRDSEIVEKKETTNQREEKPVIDSRRMKEVHQNLTEKQKAVQAKLVTQEQMAKQLEEYLSLDRLSQFQFPGPQANFRRERSSVNHTTPVTTASAGTLEADRNSVSPKTVSAAVTLSSLEKSRTQEINSAGRSSPHQSNETRIVSAQNSLVDRAKSPRLRPGTESTISNEIVEKPRRLEAQPNLVGERLVSRESREIAPEQVPSQFAHKLMAFGSIASEHLLKEKAKQESERERYEGPFWALNRGLALNFDEMLRGGTEKSLAGNFERHLLGKENSKRTESYGDLLTSLVKSEIERSEKDRQPVEIGLRESVESQVDPRGNLQTLASSEKLSPVEHLGGNSDYEDDFRTKCEIRRIASSFVPLEPDVENKENSTIFSLRPFKSDAERKQIRDNIDRLRLMAKRRNSKDRFMVFSRRRDVRSPTTILNSVTSAINDVAGLEAVEKEMRMKLAELQKRYREKLRELARLQPKYSIDDGNGKSTPIKRGPGRPRKRKYFGASCKGDRHSPVPTADENKEGDETPPASRTQTPEPNAAASESESLVSKDSEPPKKKKKKTKQSSNPVEQEGRATAIPILGMSPVELTDIQVHSTKKKKSRKPSGVEEESIITIPKTKPNPDGKKKKTAGGSKRRKGSPTEGTLDQQVNVRQLPVVPEVSATELETDVTEAEVSSKNTKTKKLKPKKRARPKLTIDNLDGYEGKVDDESPLDSTAISCETPQASTSTKSKKAKGTKKKRKSTTNTPPKGTFEFPDMTSQDESFSENSSSVSPNEIAKEVVAMAAKQMEAQKKSMQMQCDNDDDVFTSGHDSRDGLSLLAQASFESVDKSSRRKKSLDNSVLSEDLLQKKRGRPKKETESPSSEPDPVVVPKKKKKKKVLDEDTTDVPKKKKKKKKKKITTQKEEITEEKPAEVPQEERPQLPSYQHQDKDETKQLETAVLNEDSEPEDVFRPADEIIKDSGGGLPSASLSRENDDFKGSMSSLLSDEWQPRRSERIFINSSVTTNSSSSPLSPTTKGSEFSYAKKTKKGPSVKAKMARSDSQIEEEMAESDVVLPQKVKTKAKKKRGTGKSKKRISSDEDYEPIKVSRRVRSKSRQLVDFDDADEEEADDIQEDEEPGEEGETDVEINVTDKMDTTVTGEEEQERQQAEDVEGGRDIKPEVEEQKKEAEVEDEEEDSKMDVDETVEDRSDSKQIITADEVEESTVKESKEEASQEEEKTDEASYEQPLSPEDVRFTFLTEELREGAKLLLPVDSVFFPGRISTFNEPDLFGVILDGERGRRPHWKSTEQLRTQAVKDIQPPSTKFLPIGTRVCAHWSPQYRCFYPGTVTEAPQDEKEVEGKIWIEFDDGDSGFFQLDEIKRIHPDFPVEGADSTPILPEKRPRSSSFGNSQPTAIKDSSSRLRAEENTSEFSSGNESSGEIQAKRRRLRGNRKSRDDLWLLSKRVDSDSKESNAKKREIHRNKAKEAEKHVVDSTGSLAKLKDKNYDSKESQENKVLDAPQKQKSSRNRGKVEVESKEATKIAESIKHNLPSNASAELKKSEKEIHSSDSSFKSGDYENSGKQSSDKVGAVVGNSAESSDQGEDSDANSDVETPKQEKGLRASTKGSSRTSEKDLRRRSLTLSLNSSFRSTRTEGESPTRDVLSASQDEDSESYSDAFDESPLVENKSFQPRLGRRRRSELDRLQVDMKFSGPLWQWSGKNFQNKRKGKGKKVFYKAIVRGDETISVGDCAVFMSNPTKNLNLPYVGRIESMWEGCGGNMVVKVKWFYHPEETKPGRKPSDGKQSLYRSTHVDENDVQTISHKCEVLTPEEFKQRLQSLDSPSTRTSLSDRVFCCIGSYDPNNETLQTEL